MSKRPKRPQATTDRAIKAAKPESKQYRMTAGQGMYLQVMPNGSKLWRLKYRIAGREKTLSFGAYPDVTLAQARLKREEARQQLADGIDPSELRKQQRQQAAAEALTFKVVAERWFKGHTVLAKRPWAPATARKARLYLDKDLYPVLGHKPIAEITRPELNRLIEDVEKRGAFDIAAKIRQWLSAIFDDALDENEIPYNPAKDLKPSSYARGGVTRRHHPTVSFSELPELLEKVDASGTHKVIKLAIRLLALTAVRPAELRLAKWSEFDIDNAAWTVPADRMKMRKQHTVPLPRQALAILDELRTINGEQELVFAGRIAGRPISENTINQVFRRIGYRDKQTGHGFRHLLSTELNERGYNSDWIEKQLAHNSKDKIRGVYNHADYLEQRQQMMQEWADSIDAICTGANVVSIKSKAGSA